MSTEPLLEVRDLSVTFPSEAGPVAAVRRLSYHVMPGEVLGIVGESGSGKSVSSLAVMGLLPARAKITGSIRFKGSELLGRSDKDMSDHSRPRNFDDLSGSPFRDDAGISPSAIK